MLRLNLLAKAKIRDRPGDPQDPMDGPPGESALSRGPLQQAPGLGRQAAVCLGFDAPQPGVRLALTTHRGLTGQDDSLLDPGRVLF